VSIFDKLKNLASTSVDVMARTADMFPPLDSDYVKRSTNLLERGKENGSSNIPSQNDTTQDSVELDIKSRVEELRDRYKRDYDLELDVYKGRVATYTNILDIQGIRTEFDAKIGNIKADYKGQTDSLFMEAKQLEGRGDDIRSFRSKNQITNRLPDYPKDSLKAWMIIAVLALAELALNFFLLRESGDVLAVVVQSLLYGLINVILPFTLFATMVRYVNHVNPVYVSMGYICIFIYIGYTLFINLLVAHYRGVSMELAVEIGQAVEFNQGLLDRYLETAFLAFSNFKSNWFGLQDIWSWFLFLGGCGLSLGAIREGYISDDKYPGYGKLHRTYVSDFDEYLEATEEITDSQTAERDSAMDELKNDITTLENSHTKIPTIVQSAATLKERCYSALDSLDTSYNMLLKAYREQNKMHRTEPVPTFFDQEYKIEKPELISFEVGEVKNPSDVIQELQECSNQLHEIYKKNIEKLSSTEELLGDNPFKVEVK